jgi:hypothetical protein
MGWEGTCKKAVYVGDLQGVFHYIFIYLHLSDGLGRCMQKTVLEIFKVSSNIYLFICIYLMGWEGACKKTVLEIFKVSSNIYLFICIYLMGWEGACKKTVCVGDLQGVFHYIFIYLHLSDRLGRYMQKGCLC